MDVRSLSVKIDVTAPDLKKVYAEWMGEISKVDSATQKVGKTGSSFEKMNKELSDARVNVSELNKNLVGSRQLIAELNKNLSQTRALMGDVARQSKNMVTSLDRSGRTANSTFSGIANTLPGIKNDLSSVNKTTEQLGRQTTPDLRAAYAKWMAEIQNVGKATEQLGRNTSYERLNRDISKSQALASQLRREFSDMRGGIGEVGKVASSTFSSMLSTLEGVRKKISDIILSTGKWAAILTVGFAALSLGFLIREGIEFNKIIETSRIGIGAVVAATQEISDAQGNVLTGAEKFNAALVLSRDIQQQLQVMNLQTSATYGQLLLTAQAVIPAAAGQGIELDKSLQLTKALVQATSGIGLEMKQAVSESRSLLEGSINPMTDQLANALNISAKDVKAWQEKGILADMLLQKLENFIRAGELAQYSFAGITSNLKDAVGIVSGAAFQGTFDSLKRIGQTLIESMVTFKDKSFEVNPALLEIGKIIDDEIVYWLNEAQIAVTKFAKSFDPQDIKKGLNEVKLELADILDSIDSVIKFAQGDTDFLAYGALGLLLLGPAGALAGALAGLYDDFKKFREEMGLAMQVSSNEALQVVEKNEKRIKELNKIITESVKEMQEYEPGYPYSDSIIRNLQARIDNAKKELEGLHQANIDIAESARVEVERTIQSMGEEIEELRKRSEEIFDALQDPNISEAAKQQLTQEAFQIDEALANLLRDRQALIDLQGQYITNEAEAVSTAEQQAGFLADAADRLRESVQSSMEAEAYLRLIEKYMSTIAPNSFTFAAGLTSALGASIQIEDIWNRISKANGGKGFQTRTLKQPGDTDDDKGAKRKANERKRIEEQLTNEIKKLTLDRESYERFQIEQTVKKAQEAGADKAIIAEFIKQKDAELIKKRFGEIREEVQELYTQIELLGKSPNEIAKFMNAVNKAKALAQKLPEEQLQELFKLYDEITAMQIEFNNKQARIDFEESLSGLDVVEVQVRNVRIEFAELVKQLLAIANDPRLSKEFGIDIIKANELIAQGIRETNKEIENIEREGYVKRLKLSDSFWDNLKGGFLEFALSVESNGELAAQFFADTLSQMSQNFSDFFYNVITGKFDDLVDVAKNAFRSILRAFLDMVSAIATRQIVVSIAGSLGVGKGQPGGAAGALGLGKDVLGLAGGAIGLGGAAAGGAGLLAGSGALAGATTGIPTFLMGTAGGTALATSGGAGVLATIGAAAPYVGAVLAAAAIAYTIIGPLLKKTPRLDIEFDEVKNGIEERAAVVAEFLDPQFFMDNIGRISVKRGGVGIGAGGSEKILELIQQRIQETIEGIQDIIRRLPAEIFNQLNETLLNAEIDTSTIIGGERLLEFDAKGKKIAEKFQAFIEGELPAKFFAAIRESFFEPAFRALGVSAEGAQDLIDQFLSDMEAAGSREERAVIGQEFLATFSAFVDAFNIVSGNANDAIGQTIQSINQLSNKLGFDAVPRLEDLRVELAALIENAELDPETVQAYADLRNAIISATSAIFQSIGSIIGQLQNLNATIVGFGGAAVELSGFLATAAGNIQNFLESNKGELSLAEQESFLGQLMGIADAMLAEEMAAFQKQLEAEQQILEREKQSAQQRLEGLQNEKQRIEEAYRARIDALNNELRVAEQFKSLTESLKQTLDSILLSTESVLTPIEQVALLQGRITTLQADMQGATDEELLTIVPQLEEAFKNLFDAAGNAFGVNSPEFVSIFGQVTGGLEALAALTATRGRSVEEISAEIERLTAEQNTRLAGMDARIEAQQNRIAALNEQVVDNTFVASEELQNLYEYIRSEYIRILEEQFERLGEVSSEGFANEIEGLEAISEISEESLVAMKEQVSIAAQQLAAIMQNGQALGVIAQALTGKVPKYQGGTGGVVDFGSQSLAFLHGKEAVFTQGQLEGMYDSLTMAVDVAKNVGEAIKAGSINSLANMITNSGYISDFFGQAQSGGLLNNMLSQIVPQAKLAEIAERSGIRADDDVISDGNGTRFGDTNITVIVNETTGNAEETANMLMDKIERDIKTGGRLRRAMIQAAKERM